ncbi:MAG: prolipoprotein diacylglyceryl transferase family protein [Limisphaerales bacterium]
MMLHTLNRFLDGLPRTRVGTGHRPAPAFRTCGIVGFYVALITLFAGGLLAGRSLVVLAAIALVSGLSFFVYTYLRKWITGREELVLLEHVWFAYACNAGTLLLLGEPLLPYLDLFSVALCPFLAAGRVGCTLVGCCHGLPSSFGIKYTEECAADGFPRHLVGIRLFPAPTLEGIGLVLIGLTGLIALPFAAPGRVLAWFLLAYAIMRFGLEGIRGDRRPHFLGLSQARWMALGETGLALGFGAGVPPAIAGGVGMALLVTLILALDQKNQNNPRIRLLAQEHVQELRELARDFVGSNSRKAPARPESKATSRGVTLAATPQTGSPNAEWHVSLRLPTEHTELPLLCELAARAFPELPPRSAAVSSGQVLHFGLPSNLPPNVPSSHQSHLSHLSHLGTALYGVVLHKLQHPSEPEPYEPAPAPPPAQVPHNLSATPPWYLAGGRPRVESPESGPAGGPS